jgi:hypothetical protein
MENLNITYISLAFLGMTIHILMKISARMDKSTKPSFKAFFADRQNWIRIILSVLSTFAILLMADDIADVMQIKLSDDSPAKSILAFLAGYMNHSMIRNLLEMFKSTRNKGNDEIQ